VSDFPRTQIEDLSVPRLLIGTNWFLGFSHTSQAQDDMIRERMTRERITDVLEVFFRAGVDAIYGTRPESPHLDEAITEAEQRTGRKCIKMGTPHFDLSGTQDAMDANARTLDGFAETGCSVCLPHMAVTDTLADRRARCIREMDVYAAMIRERGMIPGLSTHMPEVPIYADETNLDVGTYIQIYNAAGFLMQIEADWVQRMIWQRKRPVIAIKPLAAGRLQPLVGLAFVWATLRQKDMVCIGTMSADEAHEVIEISRALMERRLPNVGLQKTRSKASM
jgi:hypothetical protein